MKRSDWETLNFQAEGHTFQFRCYSYGTRNGFAHHAELWGSDGDYLGQHSCYYLNRTWELYTYQTTCAAIVRDLLSEENDGIRAAWMDHRGYLRMTAKRREEYEAERPDSVWARRLRALLFAIDGIPSPYDWQCGERENAILKDTPLDVRSVETAPGHEVYKIVGASGAWCEYDKATRSFVG